MRLISYSRVILFYIYLVKLTDYNLTHILILNYKTYVYVIN